MGITREQFNSLKPNQQVKIVSMPPRHYFVQHIPQDRSFNPDGAVGKFVSFVGINYVRLLFRKKQVDKIRSFIGVDCAQLLFRNEQIVDCHFYIIEKIIEEEPGITIEEFKQLKPGQKVQFTNYISNKKFRHLSGKICTIDSICNNSFFKIKEACDLHFYYFIIAQIIEKEDTSDDDEMPPLASDTEILQKQEHRARVRLDALEQAWTDFVTEISKPRTTLFKFTYTVKDHKIAAYLQERLIAEGARCTIQTSLFGAILLHIYWD